MIESAEIRREVNSFLIRYGHILPLVTLLVCITAAAIVNIIREVRYEMSKSNNNSNGTGGTTTSATTAAPQIRGGDRFIPMGCSSWRKPLPLLTQALLFIPILFVAIFILAGALVVTNSRMPDPRIVRPLPDIGFELFPKIGWLETMTDVCIGILNALTVLVIFKLYLFHRVSKGLDELRLPFRIPFLSKFVFGVWDSKYAYGFDKKDLHLIAWIRFVTTYIVVLLFRSVVIVMTSYPATDNHCQNPEKITNPLKNMVLTMVTFGSGSIHCGDLMFSGHTIIITLSLMIQWIYGRMLHWIFRPLSLLLVLFSFYCIIASRSHYTDDIIVSLYGTAVTFLAIGHSSDGAPWQLQLLIRWCPCKGCCFNREELEVPTAFVTVEVVPPQDEEEQEMQQRKEQQEKQLPREEVFEGRSEAGSMQENGGREYSYEQVFIK